MNIFPVPEGRDALLGRIYFKAICRRQVAFFATFKIIWWNHVKTHGNGGYYGIFNRKDRKKDTWHSRHFSRWVWGKRSNGKWCSSQNQRHGRCGVCGFEKERGAFADRLWRWRYGYFAERIAGRRYRLCDRCCGKRGACTAWIWNPPAYRNHFVKANGTNADSY